MKELCLKCLTYDKKFKCCKEVEVKEEKRVSKRKTKELKISKETKTNKG